MNCSDHVAGADVDYGYNASAEIDGSESAGAIESSEGVVSIGPNNNSGNGRIEIVDHAAASNCDHMVSTSNSSQDSSPTDGSNGAYTEYVNSKLARISEEPGSSMSSEHIGVVGHHGNAGVGTNSNSSIHPKVATSTTTKNMAKVVANLDATWVEAPTSGVNCTRCSTIARWVDNGETGYSLRNCKANNSAASRVCSIERGIGTCSHDPSADTSTVDTGA